jgi:hypothetical protein
METGNKHEHLNYKQISDMLSQIKSLRWQHILVILMIALVAVGTDGCKPSGKLTKKEKKAQIEMYKKQLREIVNGTTKLSLADQEVVISEAINGNFNDEELNQLIIQSQQKTKQAYAEQQKIREQKIAAARTQLYDLLVNKGNLSADELEREMNLIKAGNLGDSEIDELLARLEKKITDMRSYSSVSVTMKSKLESSFMSIADAAKSGNLNLANSLIQGALGYFSNTDVPVLIIISREGSIVDYDKPTTIGKYLNFLKDQKESRNSVDSYQLDSGGKIKELDLIKN